MAVSPCLDFMNYCVQELVSMLKCDSYPYPQIIAK